MAKTKKMKETDNFFSNLWGSIFIMIILIFGAYSVGQNSSQISNYNSGYLDGQNFANNENNNKLNECNNKIQSSYDDGYFNAYNEKRFTIGNNNYTCDELGIKYNKLSKEYNKQNQKITIFQNGLLSCGINFNNLLN